MKMQWVLIGLGLISHMPVHAETLAQFEQNLIRKYDQSALSGGRIEADQYNQQIAQAVSQKLKSDPKSFDYAFKQLTDRDLLRVHYSPDRKLKVYTLDVSSGGSMRFFENLLQYRQGTQVKTQTLDDRELIKSIQQTDLAESTTYMLLDHGIWSSCEGSIRIAAYQFNRNGLAQTAVFQSRRKSLSQIAVPYRCSAFPDNSPYASDYSVIAEGMIQPAKNLQHIDIRLMNKALAPQEKFLRYQKQGAVYQYIGVVNAET